MAKPKATLTEAEKAMILDLLALKPRPTLDQITAELGLSRMTVYRFIRAAGGMRDVVGHMRAAAHLTGEEIIAMIDAYNNHTPVRDLCEDYNITIGGFYDILHAGGVPTISAQRAEQQERNMEDAITMYNNNEPTYAIADATGVASVTLYKELHRRGIPLRRAASQQDRTRRRIEYAERQAATGLTPLPAPFDHSNGA